MKTRRLVCNMVQLCCSDKEIADAAMGVNIKGESNVAGLLKRFGPLIERLRNKKSLPKD